jgi:hypothetical protein
VRYPWQGKKDGSRKSADPARVERIAVTSKDHERLLVEMPFSFQVTRDGKVLLSWKGELKRCLKGRDAQRFMARVHAATPEEAQYAMAKATGNFKLGNEKKK